MPGGFQVVAELLTTKVPYALEEQLLGWVSKSTLDRSVRDGFLVRRRALVRYPLLPLEEPLDTWSVTDHPDLQGDPAKIAYQAQARWHDRPPRTMAVYIATPRLAKAVGGVATGEIRRGLQVTHDVHLLECWRRLSPEAQESWEGERLLGASGWELRKKVPDAIVTLGDARIAVEFGGQYGPERIEDFQRFCVREGLSYILF